MNTGWVQLAYILGDSSGRETLTRFTGGMKVKADRDESSPYAAMLAAQDVAIRCKELGINALHIKIRATGGMRCPRFFKEKKPAMMYNGKADG